MNLKKLTVPNVAAVRGARRVRPLVAVLVAVLAVAAVATVLTGDAKNRVTADFDRATGLFEGSSVRVLGMPVGEVTKVEPRGRLVRVTMEYDAERRVPADAQAFIVANTLASDRYVQLAPVYRGGQTMQHGAHIPRERTHAPVELSQVVQSVSDLSKALGPNGANKDGALSRLLTVSAQNLEGNGALLNSAVRDLSTLVSTFADNKDNLTGTINNLAAFTDTLFRSDAAVRRLTQNMASVGAQLDADRDVLAAALRNLSIALGEVTTLVRENKAVLVADVEGLIKVTDTIVKQKDAFAELLDVAPLALQNLNGLVDAGTESLATRNNASPTDNPTLYLCHMVSSLTANSNACNSGPLAGVLTEIVGGGAR